MKAPWTSIGGGHTAPLIVRRPVDLKGTEIELAGSWLPLPSLKFADQLLFPLLGRDIIFSRFELRMTSTHFELL
jgi:hypothetical protein